MTNSGRPSRKFLRSVTSVSCIYSSEIKNLDEKKLAVSGNKVLVVGKTISADKEGLKLEVTLQVIDDKVRFNHCDDVLSEEDPSREDLCDSPDKSDRLCVVSLDAYVRSTSEGPRKSPRRKSSPSKTRSMDTPASG